MDTENIYLANLSRNIGLALQLRGMNQSDLARELGLTRASVSAWVSCVCPPSFNHLIKLAHTLGLTVSQLIGEKQ